MDRGDDLERMQWSAKSTPSKGPKRICKFCVLAIILPVVCLIVPMYMRFQALKPHILTFSPSDMKLLNQESSVSTVWCQGQKLTMNSTFNAYLLTQKPRLQRLRHHVQMPRKMILEDDIKEYWAFYLLKGSVVRLRACSRHEGASFIVVKGFKDARRCSFLGELDSHEESDQISDEFEFTHQILTADFEEELVQANITDSAVPFISRDKINELTSLSKDELITRMISMMQGTDLQDPEIANRNYFEAFQVKLSGSNSSKNNNPTFHPSDDLFEEYQEQEDGPGGEVFDQDDHTTTWYPEVDDEQTTTGVPDDVYDLMHKGVFNQKDPDGKDMSREEVRSSWSSSEEALMNCEGLIFNVPLDGDKLCTDNATLADLAGITANVTLEVEHTGFYYFIFSNENELTDNFLSAHFDMHKTVFDVSDSIRNCTETEECSMPLNFWSEEHLVIEVPESINETDPCEALQGVSSVKECHRIIVAESECQPRRSIYMLMVLIVPILVLLFAYI